MINTEDYVWHKIKAEWKRKSNVCRCVLKFYLLLAIKVGRITRTLEGKIGEKNLRQFQRYTKLSRKLLEKPLENLVNGKENPSEFVIQLPAQASISYLFSFFKEKKKGELNLSSLKCAAHRMTLSIISRLLIKMHARLVQWNWMHNEAILKC